MFYLITVNHFTTMFASLMPARKTCLTYAGLALLMLAALSIQSRAQSVTLYTPYTKISVPPGESINYDIDVINKGGRVVNAAIFVHGLPKGWAYTAKSGGWSVGQVAVLPKDKKTINLQVQVPLQVNKGTYHFIVSAGGIGQLPLTVVVSQQGTFKTEFISTQPNMQGAANSVFTYTATLRNGTSANQVYSLNANVMPGWTVNFKADYKQVSSVSIEANKTKDITIEVDPPDETPAGKYKVPVIAATNATSAELGLDLVVTGSYGLQLSTPSGLLSAKTTAGDEKKVEFFVKNTGSAPLKDIELQTTAPANWDINFDTKKIASLDPGASTQVFAIIKADHHAIPGDYVAILEAKAPSASAKAELRVTVETSVLSGWLGLLIVLLALGSVYYLFKKYGRR